MASKNFCTSCGHGNTIIANFCQSCGEGLKEGKVKASKPKVYIEEEEEVYEDVSIPSLDSLNRSAGTKGVFSLDSQEKKAMMRKNLGTTIGNLGPSQGITDEDLGISKGGKISKKLQKANLSQILKEAAGAQKPE
tara:strand:+ start:93028 stop:93432 length:405 start_codon:yes stop_codon:yes gene_type:complete